jgi:hypothetical protein
MSPTARVALAVVCWSLALVSELVGLALLVAEGRRTGRSLRRWRAVDPEDEGLIATQRQLDALADVLAGNSFDRTAVVLLLGVGIVAGTVGNLLTV